MKCSNCGLKLSDPSFVTQASGTCPNCGHHFDASDVGISDHPIGRYYEDLKAVLLRPRSFFAAMPRDAGLTHPLAFALITHWIGTATGFLWTTFSERSAQQMMDHWMAMFGSNDQIDVIRRSAPWSAARHAFAQWFWGMGSVVADPFITLLSLLITSFFVFLGARLFVGVMSDAPTAGAPRGHPVTYESAVRIMAYGTVASIFLVLPWFGPFVAFIYGLYISVVGAKEIYRVGTGRGLLIVLFPKILVFGMFFSFFALFVLVALKLFAGMAGAGF